MPMPVVNTADVRQMVLEGLNISKTTYGTHDGSPLYKLANINDVIMQGDIEIVKLIMRTPGHPRKMEYRAEHTISTPGVTVPIRDTFHHVGELQRVDITRNDDVVVVGKTAPPSKITQWLLESALYGGNDVIDGYYDYSNDNFIFTGKNAKLVVLNVSAHTADGSDTALFLPFEYKRSLVNYAMKELLKRDPAKVALQQEYAADWQKDVEWIMGLTPNPPESYQRQQMRG